MILLKQEDTLGFRFTLKSKSGNLLLESEAFTSEIETKNMIQKMADAAHFENSVERKTDPNGKFVFHLKQNNVLIAKSQLYSSEAGMENGIKNVKKLFGQAAL